MRIGQVDIPSQLALAPMAGVTDAAFRQICAGLGAGLTCTELVSAKALCYQDKKSRQLLRPFPGERPFAAQIFGSDIPCMAEAAQIAIEASGADLLDINMGCPVGKVVKSGDGAALMRDPEKAARLAEAVVKASPAPVTAFTAVSGVSAVGRRRSESICAGAGCSVWIFIKRDLLVSAMWMYSIIIALWGGDCKGGSRKKGKPVRKETAPTPSWDKAPQHR